jgi:hypothetical protein
MTRPPVSDPRLIEATHAQEYEETQKQRKKRQKLRWIWGGFGTFLLFMIILIGSQSPKGTAQYGVCRTVIEQFVPYPSTLKITDVRPTSKGLKVDFSHYTPHGQYMLQTALCVFKPEPKEYLILTKVMIDRIAIPDTVIQQFNKSAPLIPETGIDLTLPSKPSDQIKNLKSNF